MKKPTRLLFAAAVIAVTLIPAGGWATHPGVRITGRFASVYNTYPDSQPVHSGDPLIYSWQLGCNQALLQDVMVKESGETAVGVSIVDVGAHAGKHARFKIDSRDGSAWFWRQGGALQGIPVACSTVLEIFTGTASNQWHALIIPSNARWMSARRSGPQTNPFASWELYVCPVSPPTSTHPCNP